MSTEIAEEKKALRRMLFQARSEMPFDSRGAADRKIAEAVLQHPAYKQAKQIFCYVSMPHEVSTRTLLSAALNDGKILGLPVCEPATCTMTFYRLDALSELKAGAFRIPVPPVSEDRILLPDEDTLMIVPMLAFDAEGYRLGAGGGYYDRYLEKYQIRTLGICYAACRQTALPHDATDRRLEACITEQKTEDFYG
ncbi:MAG: 5-formyltetrahydrofolate cyclo-ligase [Oscillospiraceae bacterium]|nr:5-formyltetrahydrofolate cyclo-ligase [Oscillospiraceae bacterium]